MSFQNGKYSFYFWSQFRVLVTCVLYVASWFLSLLLSNAPGSLASSDWLRSWSLLLGHSILSVDWCPNIFIFNTYFVSIGQQLASKIPPQVHHTYPVKVNGPKNSFVLHDTFVEEVNMVINNLLVSKSNGKMIFQLTFLNCVRIPHPPSWCRYLIFA